MPAALVGKHEVVTAGDYDEGEGDTSQSGYDMHGRGDWDEEEQYYDDDEEYLSGQKKKKKKKKKAKAVPQGDYD